ncbi:MAG: DEAD/DEAH box helicase [Rothia sp. (in: high G+C Gram-positive bacteria)]|nr:DEAD/DEAH box helicase [Rothia sp. (in: high G+C Gram-positive bacteria)]
MSEKITSGVLSADNAYGFIDKETPSQRIYNPSLLNNSFEKNMVRAIKDELTRSESFKFSVAFINSSGLGLLKQHLLDFKGHGVIYTSTYLDFNDPGVFEELLKLENIEVRVLNDAIDAFHTKGYVFKQQETTTAIIGSSNLTRGALTQNEEWNIRFSAMPDGHIVEQLDAAIDRLEAVSEELTPEWIRQYEGVRNPKIIPTAFDVETGPIVPVGQVRPNEMQQKALAKLKDAWGKGNRALVISATGTGKTILAALAVRQERVQRVLFVVHREQILRKARDEFQKVIDLPEKEFGLFVGSQRELSCRFVFATVQTLSKTHTLENIPADYFDYIIIDEAHRSGSPSYQKLINYFSPQYLLGLTATPERTDHISVYEVFNHNVAYEIRLQEALEAKMLVPFSYYGISDYTDSNNKTIDDNSELARLILPERVDYIVQMVEEYGHPRNVKGLIFCGSKDEARKISTELNNRQVNGKKLRTIALDGDTTQQERAVAVQNLQNGELDYLITIDIFNEGIDIPSINQVVMLRHTKSSIIFTQQLGRGLRKYEGKDHLRVLDFIGNYENNFLIPIALFGDNSSNKDSIRRKMIHAQEAGLIAGVSSVTFDEVAQERIFKALYNAKLDNMRRLRDHYWELENRLGRVPNRYDFANADTVDPNIFLSAKKGSYWGFLKYLKKVTDAISNTEEAYLLYLDKEFLNGKRPHELLILEELLKNGVVSKQRAQEIFRDYGAHENEFVYDSVANFLNLEYFDAIDRKNYMGNPLASYQNETYILDSKFKNTYLSKDDFAAQVRDVISTGLYINQHKYSRAGELLVERNYTRRDVGRLLNWLKYPGHQNVGGYFRDKRTGTCPIFITYHKGEDVDASVNYADRLEDEHTLSWFTKNQRRITSDVESGIIKGNYQLDIFVRKSREDTFVYLGRSRKPREVEETQIANKPVVSMKLDFVMPLKPVLVDYLKTKEQVS